MLAPTGAINAVLLGLPMIDRLSALTCSILTDEPRATYAVADLIGVAGMMARQLPPAERLTIVNGAAFCFAYRVLISLSYLPPPVEAWPPLRASALASRRLFGEIGDKVLEDLGFDRVYNLGAFMDWAEAAGSIVARVAAPAAARTAAVISPA
jgi:hypothetical protein